MKARLAVQEAIRRIDRSGELVVEEARSVIEPLRIGILSVRNPFGQIAAVGDTQHVQNGILAAVFRQAVDEMTPVGRRAPPVERDVSRATAERGRIHENPLAALVTNEEPIVVGTLRSLLNEREAAGALHAARQHGLARQLFDPRKQRLAPREPLEQCAGMAILTLEEGQPFAVLVVFHPSVRIAQRLPEVDVAHDLDPSHGSGRYGRRSARRLMTRRRAQPGVQQKCTERADAAGEKFPSIEHCDIFRQ